MWKMGPFQHLGSNRVSSLRVSLPETPSCWFSHNAQLLHKNRFKATYANPPRSGFSSSRVPLVSSSRGASTRADRTKVAPHQGLHRTCSSSPPKTFCLFDSGRKRKTSTQHESITAHVGGLLPGSVIPWYRLRVHPSSSAPYSTCSCVWLRFRCEVKQFVRRLAIDVVVSSVAKGRFDISPTKA